mmetsp:Transcript_20472/g.51856  ORF Transcript_20472/g.51856 Transcript_20472/m.51856 type:complete len:203 (-) Transcript_20472:145-753(-)
MVNINKATRVCVAVCCLINCPPAELDGVLHRQVVGIPRIQHAIRKRRARSNTEDVALQTRAVIAHIEKGRARMVPAGNHGSHGKTVVSVLVNSVLQHFCSSSNTWSALGSEFKKTALNPQFAFPVRAIRCTTSHCAKKVRVDLNHLLHSLGGDVIPHGSTGVHSNNNSALEKERQSRCALLHFYVLVVFNTFLGDKMLLHKL